MIIFSQFIFLGVGGMQYYHNWGAMQIIYVVAVLQNVKLLMILICLVFVDMFDLDKS